MKKIGAFFMALAFALTLGVAFAEEPAPATAGKTPATTEKAPAKVKAKKARHSNRHKKEAAPATK